MNSTATSMLSKLTEYCVQNLLDQVRRGKVKGEYSVNVLMESGKFCLSTATGPEGVLEECVDIIGLIAEWKAAVRYGKYQSVREKVNKPDDIRVGQIEGRKNQLRAALNEQNLQLFWQEIRACINRWLEMFFAAIQGIRKMFMGSRG